MIPFYTFLSQNLFEQLIINSMSIQKKTIMPIIRVYIPPTIFLIQKLLP